MQNIKLSTNYNEIDLYKEMIGKKISKKSNRPFKNQHKIDIPTAIVRNPHTNKLAFVLSGEDNYVDCHMCKIVD